MCEFRNEIGTVKTKYKCAWCGESLTVVQSNESYANDRMTCNNRPEHLFAVVSLYVFFSFRFNSGIRFHKYQHQVEYSRIGILYYI